MQRDSTNSTIDIPLSTSDGTSGNLSEKEMEDKAFFDKWHKEQEGIANTKKHIGFIA